MQRVCVVILYLYFSVDDIVIVASSARHFAIGDPYVPGDVFDADTVLLQQIDRQRHQRVVGIGDGKDFQERRHRTNFSINVLLVVFALLELQLFRRALGFDLARLLVDEKRRLQLDGAVAKRRLVLGGDIQINGIIVHRRIGGAKPCDRKRRQNSQLLDRPLAGQRCAPSFKASPTMILFIQSRAWPSN